jgi:ABC-type antimicrobial peptide transport system permease subunit
MVVAILGMFNTLTIALLERTKEIGLMIALGARRSDMRKLFIFEAILISFIGSVIGVTIAVIAGKLVNLYINIGAAQRGVADSFELFANPPWVIGSIILGTVIIGIVVVYIPARRAERINPIDALRRE